MELAPHVNLRLLGLRRPVDAGLPREVPHDRTALADRQITIVQHRQLTEGGTRLPIALKVVEYAVIGKPARLENQPRQLTQAAQRKVFERERARVHTTARPVHDCGPALLGKANRRRRIARGARERASGRERGSHAHMPTECASEHFRRRAQQGRKQLLQVHASDVGGQVASFVAGLHTAHGTSGRLDR